MKNATLIFADYYDSTTTSVRVLQALRPLTDNINILYWARSGTDRNNLDKIFEGIHFNSFNSTAKQRSLHVLFLFFKFQLWIFRKLLKNRPKFVIAFTFYSIVPALLYKYLFNIRSKVIYDPRDYVADSYRVIGFIKQLIRFIDNVFMRLSDFVIFPDNQYFIHYGIFELKPEKYLIIPNSTDDRYEQVEKIDIRSKYKIPVDKHVIPVLGYFSETRGEKILFDVIERKAEDLIFVFAGDIRDMNYLEYFKRRDNILFLGKISYLDALALMKTALIVPQLYDPSLLNNVYAIPTKYYDCLMVGAPVVVSTGQKDVADEIVKEKFGWAIHYEDSKALVHVIDDYKTNLDSIRKEKLREKFLEQYDYSIFRKKLNNIYDRFID